MVHHSLPHPVGSRSWSNALGGIEKIREQLRSVPNKGFGFYGKELKRKHHAEISFNYLGHFENVNRETSLFESILEPHGNMHAPSSPRMYLLDVNAMIVQEKLRVVWSYNQNIHRKERIQALADYLIAQLKVLCHEMQEKKVLAVSDFPLATLTEERLERLLDTHGTFELVFDLSPFCSA
ncbi:MULTISPECIES: condensation domain-containing protein [Thermoactinomyces]|uniref:Uncharacterized protein n=1 Tax=Thermoactinomyces vulgaris TaxID=2026 RepID=A0ABS0QET6_THEVU|nr:MULTISPECIES: condensation domain-containing protein [Thermoactinomyces]MBA4551333.1 hypothetical protein [Thermoactinomyces vulgaris]MBA4595457.1 hypothetical protein [Thermoactinomyces vulgaris]MBH8587758.1 hypothetical protein [Thermoactinomyces vulgaris]MBI0385919.1 hypothetical protein [Thermoactinomyces sp. CICC 24227]